MLLGGFVNIQTAEPFLLSIYTLGGTIAISGRTEMTYWARTGYKKQKYS